jgi:tetratricopeptide (TPR) repeat protein
MTISLKAVLKEGVSAKDVERLRIATDKPEDKRRLAREADAYLQRSAVTLLPPQRAALWFQIAEAYREGESLADALTVYSRALEEDPSHIASARALIDLAEALDDDTQLVHAIAARLVQLRKPGHEEQRVDLHRRAAEAYVRLAQPDRAFFELLRALKVRPQDEALWDDAQGLAEAARGYSELGALLEDLATRTKDREEERRYLKRLYELCRGPLTDPTRAQTIYEHLAGLPLLGNSTAVTSAADVARVMIDLDELRATEAGLRRQRRYKDLLEAYAQHLLALGADEHEEKSDVALTAAVVAAHELSDLAQAKLLAEKAVRIDPQSVAAHRFIIDLALTQEDFAHAVAACERFAEACEASALDALLMACEIAHARLQDRGRALRAFEWAKTLAPEHPGVAAFARSLGA